MLQNSQMMKYRLFQDFTIKQSTAAASGDQNTKRRGVAGMTKN